MGLSYSSAKGGQDPSATFSPCTNSRGDIVKWYYAAFALLSSGFDSRYLQEYGGMPERLNGAVSKTAVPETVPGVQIPLPPKINYKYKKGFEREKGRENVSFPVVEALKPQGFKERSDVRLPPLPKLKN
jgi:hypothetical protein